MEGKVGMEALIEGRLVHYVMANGAHRPAIVVNAREDINGPAEMGEGFVNLIVFLDGPQDRGGDMMIIQGHLGWVGYVSCSSRHEPNTWHWIEKS